MGLDPEKTILISGAIGALGALTARHLAAEHGARHLLLVSRSGEAAPGAAELASDLEELGAEATIAACDVSERSRLEELLASIPTEHPLGAVVHAAGALDDATIEGLSAEQLERVFAPKADAAWHLHELTADMDLSAFVLYSSAAAALGSPGQGSYAAANAFLDALAERRRAGGLAATSIAWGLWRRESGMTSALGEADLARMRRSGIAALGDEQGLALFDQALRSERPGAMALRLDRAGLRSQAAAGILPALLRGLVRAPRRRSAGPSLATRLAATPEPERAALVLDLVRGEVAAVLGHASAAAIDPDAAFKDLGFDSLAAVELRNRLNVATGLRLTATSVFDHPSPAALADHVLAKVSPRNGAAGTAIESREREVREALASIPLSRLRSAGLIDSLLRLASPEGEADAGEGEDGDAIDTMDVEELIRRSAGGSLEGQGR